jgi:hypothetical protein
MACTAPCLAAQRRSPECLNQPDSNYNFLKGLYLPPASPFPRPSLPLLVFAFSAWSYDGGWRVWEYGVVAWLEFKSVWGFNQQRRDNLKRL